MDAMIGDPEMAKKFILAGKAIVTLVSLKSGKRYTYRIKLAPKKEGMHTAHFVDLLTGQDNENDYSPLGIIIEGRFFPTKIARTRGISDSTPSVIAIRYVLDDLMFGNTINPMVEIWHAGRCGKCGRKLTVPESIATGLGPDCAGRMLMGQ